MLYLNSNDKMEMKETPLVTIIFFTIILLGLIPVPLPALDITDLDDHIYSLLEEWENRGYIHALPMLRPYPKNLIVQSLREVVKNGDNDASSEAGRILFKLNDAAGVGGPGSNMAIAGKGFFLSFKPGSRYQMHYGNGNSLPYTSLGIYTLFSAGNRTTVSDAESKRANGEISRADEETNSLSIDGRYGAFLVDRGDTTSGSGVFSPMWQNVEEDYQSGGGSVTLWGRTIPVDQIWSSLVSFGNPQAYLQAGIVRSAFGPFFKDGAVIGDTAPQAGHFSMTLRNQWISYTMLLLELVAKYGVDTDGSIYLLKSRASITGYPSKFLSLHFLEFYPFPWFRAGFIQSVVFGERFSPVYLIPVQALMYSQVFAGDYDNSLMGVTGIIGPLSILPGISFRFSFYVDDWNFNELMKLNLNSGQNKFALQAGLYYTPPSPWMGWLGWVDINYLMITPYMYTHSSFQPINYLTYTHNGKQLGSELPPNSDRVSAAAAIRPLEIFRLPNGRSKAVGNPGLRGYGEIPGYERFWDFEIKPFFRYIRHGEGSVFDDGYDENGNVTFYGPSTFLTGNIENVIQTGFQMSLNFRTNIIDLSIGGGYTFQRIWGTSDERKNYFDLSLSLQLPR